MASYEMLSNLFERIQFFLQRLKRYIGIKQLPQELKELLVKIMAQVLSVLAFSTKVIKERAISGSIRSTHTSLADYDAGKFLKKITRRTEVDDALQRLNMLTNEESLTAAARTLEPEGIIHDVPETAVDVAETLTVLQPRDNLQRWLNPPNPAINHNIACDIHHEGTAGWFIHGTAFEEWKQNGNLLWVCGNRTLLPRWPFVIVDCLSDFSAGSGKSVLWCAVS
jgi:hypothetical protein